MSQNKKMLRAQFRESVFARDGYRCAMCGVPASDQHNLDAHHITDRNELPAGGYVAENGISLCATCHEKAEEWHSSNHARYAEGFHPDELYHKVGSSHEKALQASLILERRSPK